MRDDPAENKSLQYFAHSVQIGYWTIVCRIISIESRFLYSCRHRSVQFRTDYQRKRHLLESHNEGTWFTCHICEKKYIHQCHLKIHLLTHEHVKPYICSECPKRFFTAGKLKAHQTVHSDFKQFICSLCNKLFKRKVAVKRHFNKCCTLPEFD